MDRKHDLLPWNLATYEDSDLVQAVPELNALQKVIEQNDWHNDDAFQQSLRLFHWVQELPASLLEVISLPEITLQAVLASVADPTNSHHTAKTLLGFAALIHDVGKTKTFQHLPDGTTRCPGHETVSARMTPTICARFDFTLAETRFMTNLVGAHGEPYALFKKIAALPAPEQQEQIRCFETQHADHLLPLLILASGDMLTSHLKAIQPEKYKAVFDFYQRWLQRIWAGKSKK